MKKFSICTTLAGILAGAGIALAQGPVFSVNIVGFNKTPVEDGNFKIAGNPFENGDNAVNTVLDDQLTGSLFVAAADQLFIWDPVGQKYTGIYKNHLDDWVYITNPAVSAVEILAPGLGFWVKNAQASSSTQTVVTVGDVISDATQNVSIVSGFQILSYPYTAPIELNDTGLTNGTGSIFVAAADQVYLFDQASQSYESFFLKNDGKFYEIANPGVEATVSLQPGDGFWYNHVGAGYTWTESIPYSIP